MKTPLYKQIATSLSEKISRGIFLPGEKIPSLRSMAKRKNVSLNSVKKAYMLLEKEGLIQAIPGSGFRVSPAPPFSEKKETVPFMPVKAKRFKNLMTISNQSFSMDSCLYPQQELARLTGSLLRTLPANRFLEYSKTSFLELKRQIALHYEWSDVSVDPGAILLTGSCLQGLFLVLQTLLNPGDTLLVQRPFFPGALPLWEILGLNLLEIPSDLYLDFDMERFETILKNRSVAACLFSSRFANPSGVLIEDGKKKRIVERCAFYGIPLVEDDVFGDLYFTEQAPRLFKSFDPEENVILVSSVSKTLSPGFRVGWIFPGRYGLQIRQMQQMTGSYPSLAMTETLREYMAEKIYERHLKSTRKVYQKRMKDLSVFLEKEFPRQCFFREPRGGLFLWVRFPGTRTFKSTLPGRFCSLSADLSEFQRICFTREIDWTKAALSAKHSQSPSKSPCC